MQATFDESGAVLLRISPGDDAFARLAERELPPFDLGEVRRQTDA